MWEEVATCEPIKLLKDSLLANLGAHTSELSHGSQKWKELPHDGSTVPFLIVISGHM